MIDILVQYRWLFLVIAIVLLFAIIGFIVLGNKKKKAETMKPVEVTPISQNDDTNVPNGEVVVPTGGDVPTSATPSLASEIVSASPENFNVFASGNETDNMIAPAEEVVTNDEPTLVILDPSTQPTQTIDASNDTNLTVSDTNSVAPTEVIAPVTPAQPEVPVTPAQPEVPVTPAQPEVPVTPTELVAPEVVAPVTPETVVQTTNNAVNSENTSSVN